MTNEPAPDTTASSTPKKSAPTLPKWEAGTRDRIAAGIRRVAKPIEALKARDAVEADTRMLVTDVLCDLLGYDKYDDLTAEYQVKGEFADYGLRVDKQLVAFVEVKRISQKLAASHLRQVENYALKNGVSWAILTNAQFWSVYHVQALAGEQSELTLVLEVDLLDPTVKASEKVERLFLISREAIQKGRLDGYWKEKFATSAKALRPILLSEPVLEEIRKELWRQMRQRVEIADLRGSIQGMLRD